MMSEMAGGTLERLRKGLRVFGFDGLNGNQLTFLPEPTTPSWGPPAAENRGAVFRT
ncbi:MAG: hypothetical protein PVF25_18180 [Desulfobacterales bacterium]|jgi:hypothetical protein